MAFDPWVWAAIAAGLAVMEMLLPGYVLLGFGLAAALVAAWLAEFPVDAGGDWRSVFVLLVAWSGLAIAIWWGLSRVVGLKVRQRKANEETDINDFDSKV